jgi:hypothetical protein
MEHSVEVTAESVYEAVARGLQTFRSHEWIADIGDGLTTVTVRVTEPAPEHHVRMKDFQRWLKVPGKTPAEVVAKERIRAILGQTPSTEQRKP